MDFLDVIRFRRHLEAENMDAALAARTLTVSVVLAITETSVDRVGDVLRAQTPLAKDTICIGLVVHHRVLC
jgi:hypothetical protein